MAKPDIEQPLVDTIRTLAMDAVHRRCRHRHRDGARPLAYVLYQRGDGTSANPQWPIRDRSSSPRTCLHLHTAAPTSAATTCPEELKRFRQWSR